MKLKKLTAVLLSAATLVSMPFMPAVRDAVQDVAVEAATYQDFYYYTTGSYQNTMITYQLDTRSRLAYIYSCVGQGEDFTIPAKVNYDSRDYRVYGICESAFENYSALHNLTISSSLTISPKAFRSTSGLETVTITREAYGITIPDYAFEYSGIRKLDCYCGSVVFGKECFHFCNNLNSVHFYDSVFTICFGESLFHHMYSLQECIIDNPNAFVCLAKSTFNLCVMETLILPETVTYIPEECFQFCSFTNFKLPESVKSIGSKAFNGATLPETFEINKGICYIADDAFMSVNGVKNYQIDSSNAYYKTENGILYNKTGTKLLCYPKTKTAETFTCYAKFFPDGCFSGNSYLRTLNLPNFLPYANGGTVYFPCLNNLENLNVPAQYSGTEIMTCFHNLFDGTKLHRINGEELLYTPENGEPYFHEKYSAYICKHFDEFTNNDIMQTYVDKMEDYVLEHEILTPGMSDIQKIMHIRKWIMDRVVYDPAGVYENYVEEDPDDNEIRNHCLGSVLLHQKIINGRDQYATVCEGYAKCYARMLNKAGIEARTVDAGTHMWNLIKLNGQWYHSDICQDDAYIDYAKMYGYPQKYINCLVPTSMFTDPDDFHNQFEWSMFVNGVHYNKENHIAVTDNRDMGDVNGDKVFNDEDVDALRSEIGTADTARIVICDLDFDGQVTEADTEILQEYIDDKWKYCATVRIWRYSYYEAH